MKKNALIVDDSRLACKVMANMLETFGIQSFAVYSAEEALEHLQHNQPDIIFLDHTMPGMDGLETIKVIKSNPLTATVPVMMYTAKEGGVYVGQARALGAVDVLPKGLEKDYLFKALKKLGLVQTNEVKKLPEIKKQTKQQAIASNASKVENKVSQTKVLKDKPLWQAFWQQRVEPYLNRQKAQHHEEFQHYTNIQTRKLTREFHQTLEQFEHALVNRIESHDEFVETKEELSKQSRTKIIIGFCVAAILLQLGIFWQLWHVNQQNNILLQAQNESIQWRKKTKQQLASFDDSFKLLESQSNRNQSLQQNSSAKRVSLVDAQGNVITDLLPIDAEKGLYRGLTDSGYQFIVNAKGQLGWPVEQRYYLTETCDGDAFVNSPSGIILKDNKGSLWFVDKHASVILMTINSLRTPDNQCVSIAGESLNLHRLQPNLSIETGIDNLQTTKLYFHQ